MSVEKIIYKKYPCTCGCQGKDPWHRHMYKRSITLLDENTGTVRLPFSTKPVKVVKVLGWWYVDHKSIVFDK